MWRSIFIIFAKEVTDNSRDRRSLLVALIYPLLGPILLGVIISAVTDVVTIGPGKSMTIHIQGAENSPDLISFFKSKKVSVKQAPKDVMNSVRIGAVDYVLIIPMDHAAKFRAQQTADIKIVVNTSRLPGLIAVNRVSALLAAFSQEVWGKRISARGVDFKILQPFRIESVNVSSGFLIFEILLSMVPPLLIFNIFMGGVYLAIDATTGERERGSLEPLLINPVDRWGFMMGKYLAACYYTVIAVVVQLLAFKAVFLLVGSSGSYEQALGAGSLLGLFILSVPLLLFAVGIQFVIATLTRSFKEAQTYLGLLPLVPAIPGMAMVFAPVQLQDWMMTIPIFSQTLLMGQFVRGEEVAFAHMIISISFTAIVVVLLLGICARLYEREKLIFGG